jgi:hypothetical protein
MLTQKLSLLSFLDIPSFYLNFVETIGVSNTNRKTSTSSKDKGKKDKFSLGNKGILICIVLIVLASKMPIHKFKMPPKNTSHLLLVCILPHALTYWL